MGTLDRARSADITIASAHILPLLPPLIPSSSLGNALGPDAEERQVRGEAGRELRHLGRAKGRDVREERDDAEREEAPPEPLEEEHMLRSARAARDPGGRGGAGGRTPRARRLCRLQDASANPPRLHRTGGIWKTRLGIQRENIAASGSTSDPAFILESCKSDDELDVGDRESDPSSRPTPPATPATISESTWFPLPPNSRRVRGDPRRTCAGRARRK